MGKPMLGSQTESINGSFSRSSHWWNLIGRRKTAERKTVPNTKVLELIENDVMGQNSELKIVDI